MYKIISLKWFQKFLLLLCLFVGFLPNQIVAQSKSLEGFRQFLKAFSQNDSIQKAHTLFPLVYKIWEPRMGSDIADISYIESLEWVPLTLTLTEEIIEGPEGYGDYRLIFEVDKRQAIIKMRGVNNGIHTNFLFIQKKRKWYLWCIEDYST